MAAVTDNLIAYKILKILITPFEQTAAFKLGIIDAEGNNLIKARSLTTTEQRNAYSWLYRLCFNVKKLIAKTPGGSNKLRNLTTALYLIKESYPHKTSISESTFRQVLDMVESGVILAEEHITVRDFLIAEDGIANVTGSGVSTDVPTIRPKRKFVKVQSNSNTIAAASSPKQGRKIVQTLNLESSLTKDGVLILSCGGIDYPIALE